MMGSRLVCPEILDGLDKDDPQALRSRRDLQRVHRVMGTRRILRRALLPYGTERQKELPLRVLELGAGDGTLMLGFARLVHAVWPPVELTLLDRVDLISPETRAGFGKLGWHAAAAVSDVLDWAQNASQSFDLIVANLFLHHFNTAQLRGLLESIAARSAGFFACEPRRSRLALLGSHLIGAIGANAVTRADSVASVRAGFAGAEIGDLWSSGAGRWTVQEYPAGLFSHCFHARCEAPRERADERAN